MAVPADASEWPRLRKTGEWSDFTVVAGGSQFRVHRVKVCKESYYSRAVCSGGFSETAKQSIELPESAQVVSTLLDEMYGVYNPTTGSIFTNFALRMEIEKELMMNQLLDLFIAADKVPALPPLFFIFILTPNLVQPREHQALRGRSHHRPPTLHHRPAHDRRPRNLHLPRPMPRERPRTAQGHHRVCEDEDASYSGG